MSSLLINRTIEDEGGSPFTTVDRNGATLGFTVAPDKAIGLIPLLATQCTFEKWDYRDSSKTAIAEAEVASQSAQVVLSENVFAAAFGAQSPVGRSVYYPSVSKDSVVAFRDRGYGLNGAVLTVTGVKDHSSFVTEAENLLKGAPLGNGEAPSPFIYLGGESRVAAPSANYAHVALAFQAPSSSVVSSIVKHYFNIAGLDSGVSSFYSTGIIGVYAGSTSSEGLVDSMFATVTKSMTTDLLKRAKNLAKAEALLALDCGSVGLANVMTSAVLESGTFIPGGIAKAYDAISEAQVKDALVSILKSCPSLAAVGNISAVPYHATVASTFK
jgi:predicted Zn-dependent peptidase